MGFRLKAGFIMGTTITLVLFFFLGVSFAMMKFMPTVKRPKINKGEKQIGTLRFQNEAG
jgi:hypothetical protein